ncbi:DUF3331 domain-containing protein [Paraburkholderia phytofirmans]|uniref:DUF3331 domain-containing protein n=1 Tax=Paraburkholderia phytofirmans TaxID=261302 RepID=UPI0038B87D27
MKVKGRCVVRGAEIRRDDLFYKARVRMSTPANASAMSLACVLERMPAIAMAGEAP